MSNNEVERKIESLFINTQFEKPKKRPTILLTLSAILATLILAFQTIAFTPPEPEATPKTIHYYKVNDPGQMLQPVAYTPIETEFHFVGCAHMTTKQFPAFAQPGAVHL